MILGMSEIQRNLLSALRVWGESTAEMEQVRVLGLRKQQPKKNRF